MKIINNVYGNLPKEPITVQATQTESLSALSFGDMGNNKLYAYLAES